MKTTPITNQTLYITVILAVCSVIDKLFLNWTFYKLGMGYMLLLIAFLWLLAGVLRKGM